MGHFLYGHLPAKGLGHRDPRRPYATGGIGDGIPVFIGDLGGTRTYAGDRIYDELARDGELVRAYSGESRDGSGVRTHIRTGRTATTGGRTGGTSRSGGEDRDYSGDRTYDPEERDGP